MHVCMYIYIQTGIESILKRKTASVLEKNYDLDSNIYICICGLHTFARPALIFLFACNSSYSSPCTPNCPVNKSILNRENLPRKSQTRTSDLDKRKCARVSVRVYVCVCVCVFCVLCIMYVCRCVCAYISSVRTRINGY